MIFREIPLSTLDTEVRLLAKEQATEEEAMFARGAMAALLWLADPDNHPAPHLHLLHGKEVTVQ